MRPLTESIIRFCLLECLPQNQGLPSMPLVSTSHVHPSLVFASLLPLLLLSPVRYHQCNQSLISIPTSSFPPTHFPLFPLPLSVHPSFPLTFLPFVSFYSLLLTNLSFAFVPPWPGWEIYCPWFLLPPSRRSSSSTLRTPSCRPASRLDVSLLPFLPHGSLRLSFLVSIPPCSLSQPLLFNFFFLRCLVPLLFPFSLLPALLFPGLL